MKCKQITLGGGTVTLKAVAHSKKAFVKIAFSPFEQPAIDEVSAFMGCSDLARAEHIVESATAENVHHLVDKLSSVIEMATDLNDSLVNPRKKTALERAKESL